MTRPMSSLGQGTVAYTIAPGATAADAAVVTRGSWLPMCVTAPDADADADADAEETGVTLPASPSLAPPSPSFNSCS